MSIYDEVRCRECHHVGMTMRGSPEEPPDPDRFGNWWIAIKCPECGQRGSITTPSPGHYGPTHVDAGFEFTEDSSHYLPR